MTDTSFPFCNTVTGQLITGIGGKWALAFTAQNGPKEGDTIVLQNGHWVATNLASFVYDSTSAQIQGTVANVFQASIAPLIDQALSNFDFDSVFSSYFSTDAVIPMNNIRIGSLTFSNTEPFTGPPKLLGVNPDGLVVPEVQIEPSHLDLPPLPSVPSNLTVMPDGTWGLTPQEPVVPGECDCPPHAHTVTIPAQVVHDSFLPEANGTVYGGFTLSDVPSALVGTKIESGPGTPRSLGIVFPTVDPALGVNSPYYGDTFWILGTDVRGALVTCAITSPQYGGDGLVASSELPIMTPIGILRGGSTPPTIVPGSPTNPAFMPAKAVASMTNPAKVVARGLIGLKDRDLSGNLVPQLSVDGVKRPAFFDMVVGTFVPQEAPNGSMRYDVWYQTRSMVIETTTV